MTLCNKVMIIDGGHVKGFDSICALTSNGITLLDYYRRCMSLERNCETMPTWMQKLLFLIPITYSLDALQLTIFKGDSIMSVVRPTVMLAVIAAVPSTCERRDLHCSRS